MARYTTRVTQKKNGTRYISDDHGSRGPIIQEKKLPKKKVYLYRSMLQWRTSTYFYRSMLQWRTSTYRSGRRRTESHPPVVDFSFWVNRFLASIVRSSSFSMELLPVSMTTLGVFLLHDRRTEIYLVGLDWPKVFQVSVSGGWDTELLTLGSQKILRNFCCTSTLTPHS